MRNIHEYIWHRRAIIRNLGLAVVCSFPLQLRAEIDFNRDIRPILSENCFLCHGPDEEDRKGGRRGSGGLRLDTEEGAKADLDGYAALVPGEPDESELLFLVTTDYDDERMPPAEHGKALSEEQIALLRQWILKGGEYDRHWSYKRIERPEAPEVDENSFVVRNEIDRFVVDRLVSEKLAQSPEADRYALARRVAMDLTGLPPYPSEVEAFVADEKPGAYERYVELQLKKPGYGEHWARMWLDLARYADSAGYADDPLREIWGFRDYVIRSFNENKPFDQFTIEQIAGDLLGEPKIDQLVATAFHRNTQTNSEGGTDDEEFRNEAVVDRVNTTMSVWMGTTMACAQCHTHKYDPITQKEYFEMFAIFNSTADEDRKDEAPILELFSDEQNRKRKALEESIAEEWRTLEAELSKKEHRTRRLEWEKRLISGEGWQPLVPLESDVQIRSKGKFSIDDEGIVEVHENLRPNEQYTITSDFPEGMKSLSGIKLEIPALEDGDPPWSLTEIEVRVVHGELSEKVVEESKGNEKKKADPPLKLVNASATFDSPHTKVASAHDGMRANHTRGWSVPGRFDEDHEASFELKKPVALSKGSKIEIVLGQVEFNRPIKRFRLWVSEEEKPLPAVPILLASTLEKPERKRSRQEKAALISFFARHDSESRESHRAIAEEKAKYDAVEAMTTVPIMAEVPESGIRKTHVQLRGSFLDKGEVVGRGLPSAFTEGAGTDDPDRLALARWLVDRENPLTARVIANRYWEAIFGVGIVGTSEEFGSQGEAPSHPELLDWLAIELLESGWDLKYLLKLIVNSATYRQSSVVTEEMYRKDPENRFLARGPRFRISAEMIRDQALFVSDLLSPKMYGPSVNPPQPEMGLKAAFGSETDWETSEGEDRYRRGIYTSWRRSNPYPSMATFDAPNREVCMVRRDRTNTPLQALVTLNDPVYIEAAQALGRRMASVGGSTAKKAALGFQLCLTRPPSVQEKETLLRLYESLKRRYSDDLKAAVDMASDPIGPVPEGGDVAEYAAWTVVANALLNLDEMFLKR